MNINNLTTSQTIKNYKELCTILEEPIKGGKSKAIQLTDFTRYFTYTKQGQKIIINEVFDKPLPKIDQRKDTEKEGNNSKYVEHVEHLLLHQLAVTEGHKYTLTKNNLLELLGMVNKLYLQKEIAKKILQNQNYQISNFDINHFYLRANDRLTRILFSSLNSLKRRFLINYREVDMIAKLDKDGIETHTEATEDEATMITGIKYDVLKEMGLSSIMQVMFRFKTEEFYSRVSEILTKEHDIKYSYKVIELLFKKENVLKELSLLEINSDRTKLNDKVIDTINTHAKNTYDKNTELYDKAWENFIYNDKPSLGAWGESQFKMFLHKPNYIDIQMELADYLLKIE
jgi:hypothetical protein